MAEEPGSIDTQRLQQCGQDVVGLLVHEIHTPLLINGAWRRCTITGARVNQTTHIQMLTKRVGKIFPHRHRAQTFVQKDYDWRIGRSNADPGVLNIDTASIPVQRQFRCHASSTHAI